MTISGPVVNSASPHASVNLRILADMGCVSWQREMMDDGTIRYPWFSDNIRDILGYTAQEITVNGKGALTVIHWADRDDHLTAVQQSAANLTPCQEDFRAITVNGETRWLRGVSYPHRRSDGVVVWDGIWQDNTQRMRAEVQHQMLMDHAADCIFIISGNACITWSNAAAERNFGYPEEELVGLCIGRLVDLPCGSNCDPTMAELETDGASCLPRGSREVIARRQDGSEFPFEMTTSEVRSDGKLSLIVIGRDISRRRKAEQMLAESEQRLRMTFAATSLGIVVVAMDGTIQFHNPAFETMAGDEFHDLMGKNLFSFVPDSVMPVPAQIPPPGMSFCSVCEPSLDDEQEHYWRLTGTQFSAEPDASELSILFFIEDVTEATQNAQERRQLELMLQEGHKLEALGRLAGGIAHELNNMLGPILMGAEMITRTAQLDAKNSERVQRIIDAAKNSRDIVRNVLAYCRKEQKTLEPVDLVPLVRGFVAMVVSALPPTIKLDKKCRVEHAMVVGDAGQLQQVLLNMTNNARDAMFGTGTLRLELTILEPLELQALWRRYAESEDQTSVSLNPLTPLDLEHTHAEIRISDSGCGMSPATAAKIFDPFFTTKPVGQGTGLGLSVVQGIIKSMGGIITVDSRLGEGTTFNIILPMVRPGA